MIVMRQRGISTKPLYLRKFNILFSLIWNFVAMKRDTSRYYIAIFLVIKIFKCARESQQRFMKNRTEENEVILEIFRKAYNLIVMKLLNNECVIEAMEFYLCALIRTSQQNRLSYTTLKKRQYQLRHLAARNAFTRLLRIYEKLKKTMTSKILWQCKNFYIVINVNIWSFEVRTSQQNYLSYKTLEKHQYQLGG